MRRPQSLPAKEAARRRTLCGVLLPAAAICLWAMPVVAQTLTPELMSFGAARPVLEKILTGEEGELRHHPEEWLAWARQSDLQVRQRLDAGEEDSLTNLLRFGVTFTEEYRIDDEYLVRYGQSSLVNAFAENRADDLIKALAAPNPNQGFVEMRAFLEKKGFSLNSSAARKKLKTFLLANLARMQKDFLQAREHSPSSANQAFQNRGISLDSNLWPDYDLDLALQNLLLAELLKPAAVQRVAVIGPGLDFVNKQEGVDYYPPQTTQPFTVLDSLLRLRLSNPQSVKLYTLDISPRVNLHLEMAKQNAAKGMAYTVQLPWYSEGRWSDDFRAKFTKYWQQLGGQIGEPIAAIPVPQGSPGFETKALKIRPKIVDRITPVNMNIVLQSLTLAPDERFDLVIGTNIFIYYGRLEQSLARANVAALLKPGGLLLSNQRLENAVPSGLQQVMVVDIPMTGPPVITDHIYCYRLTP